MRTCTSIKSWIGQWVKVRLLQTEAEVTLTETVSTEVRGIGLDGRYALIDHNRPKVI